MADANHAKRKSSEPAEGSNKHSKAKISDETQPSSSDDDSDHSDTSSGSDNNGDNYSEDDDGLRVEHMNAEECAFLYQV